MHIISLFPGSESESESESKSDSKSKSKCKSKSESKSKSKRESTTHLAPQLLKPVTNFCWYSQRLFQFSR